MGLRRAGGQGFGGHTKEARKQTRPRGLPPRLRAAPPHGPPPTCSRAGWDVQSMGPRGRAGAPRVYSGGFRITPCVRRGPRNAGAHGAPSTLPIGRQ